MDEITFFQNEGVRVTNTRFIVDGQTYAMNNITSVKPTNTPPSRVGPAVLLVIGVGLLLGKNFILGAAFAALGTFWWSQQKTLYHVLLHTAGGEAKALNTHQRDYLEQVVAALNNAIVHRG